MADLLLACPFPDDWRTRLDALFAVQRLDELGSAGDWLEQNGASLQYVLTDGHHGIGSDHIARMPHLKLISCYSVGYENVDAVACADRGIMVAHTPDVLNAEVATTALLLLLGVLREVRRDDAWVRSGDWARHGSAPLTRTVDGRRIGIVGLGRIGQEIARKLAPFSPEIVYHARNQRDVPFRYFADLVEMAAHCEVLVCITPGGEGTSHLIDASVLNALGPQGVLINVGRGTVVNERALTAALQEGRLGGAGLDVFENEPHVAPELCALPNVLLLPHAGSATLETRGAMADLAIRNLVEFRDCGRVLTPVPECAGLAGVG